MTSKRTGYSTVQVSLVSSNSAKLWYFFLADTSANCAATGDVAGAIENTWQTARAQVETVVNNVVFPVIDMILAVLLFVKIATSYMEYRKHGQFDFTAPAILFACLLFSLTAPSYIWNIL